MKRIQVAYNMDCMDLMRLLPDKEFDLAIVDPPYGGGKCGADGSEVNTVYADGRNMEQKISAARIRCNHAWGGAVPEISRNFGGGYALKCKKKIFGDGTQVSDIRDWDIAPPPEYFEELFRVSKNQIIWGGNYFNLPPTRCFIVWRKLQIPTHDFSMSCVEYAWTSFNKNALYCEFNSAGNANYQRIHPTQKPVALYNWILNQFAKPGDKILDTHLGSGSSRIAAHEMGYDFMGTEVSEWYFAKQEERFRQETAQGSLFKLDGGEFL